MTRILVPLSVLTCLVSGWMCTMYFVLRHPGYLERAGIAALILAGAAFAATGVWRSTIAGRLTIAAWAIGLLAFGLWALFWMATDDGWVIIAGTLFVAEGSVALLTSLVDRGSAIVSRGTA
jgi:hypothetical protein